MNYLDLDFFNNEARLIVFVANKWNDGGIMNHCTESYIASVRDIWRKEDLETIFAWVR